MTEQTATEAAPATEPVSSPKATKAEPHRCHCSPDCGAFTKRDFAQGHDARMVSQLVAQVAAGDQTLETAAAAIRAAGGTDRLVDKLFNAVNRLTEQAEAADRTRRGKLLNSAQAVMDYARDHYDQGGWDVIVETQELADLVGTLDGLSSETGKPVLSPKAAIRWFRTGPVATWAERQREADREREQAVGTDEV